MLRSTSDLPFVSEHRELIHKIGVTSGSVQERIARAKHDPTFLMADVEEIATYKLYNINRGKLEHLIHRIFAPPDCRSRSGIASETLLCPANGSWCLSA